MNPTDDLITSVPPDREGHRCSHDLNAPSSLDEFATWLVNAGEINRITSRRLQALYGEFCIFTETPSLSTGCLFRGLKAAGINRYREGTARRRWLYEVQTSREMTSNPFASLAMGSNDDQPNAERLGRVLGR